MLQVFPDAPYQQTRHGIHRSGDLRLEHVPATLLGLFPCGRLLQEAKRSCRGGSEEEMITDWWIRVMI